MEYLIQKGDTLSKIAKRNNTTVSELAKLNNIKNVNFIRAGDTLTLPGAEDDVEVIEAPSPYQDYFNRVSSISVPVYSAPDTSAAYASAAQSYKAALDAAYQNVVQSAQARAEELAGEYATKRNSAYVNSRLNAVGNNEALAAMGLAGNLYATNTSGLSESSRIAQNIALRNNIQDVNLQEQKEKDELAKSIVEAGLTRDIQYAQYLAELQIQQAKQAQSDAQFAYNAQMQNYQQQLGLAEALLQAALKQEEREAEQAAFESGLGTRS